MLARVVIGSHILTPENNLLFTVCFLDWTYLNLFNMDYWELLWMTAAAHWLININTDPDGCFGIDNVLLTESEAFLNLYLEGNSLHFHLKMLPGTGMLLRVSSCAVLFASTCATARLSDFICISVPPNPQMLLTSLVDREWVTLPSGWVHFSLLFPQPTHSLISISLFSSPSARCITGREDGGSSVHRSSHHLWNFRARPRLKGGIVSPWWGMPLRPSSKKRLHMARNLEESREV